MPRPAIQIVIETIAPDVDMLQTSCCDWGSHSFACKHAIWKTRLMENSAGPRGAAWGANMGRSYMLSYEDQVFEMSYLPKPPQKT